MAKPKTDLFDWDAVKAAAPLWQAAIEADMRRGDAIHRYLTETPCPYCGRPYIGPAGAHVCVPPVE